MNASRYSCHIMLLNKSIIIPFDSKAKMYLFVFSFHALNKYIFYLFWDNDLNRCFDIFIPSDYSSFPF